MTTRGFVFVLALALLHAAPLQAQPAPADLSAIRAKTDLTDEDRAQIRAYVEQRVSQAGDADAAVARRAADELRAAFDGSDSFKRTYAAMCLEAVSAAYRRVGPLPATRLLAIVNAFGLVEAHPLFLEALQDERVGVRAAGAIGLQTLRAQLSAAGREVFLRALDGLKEAGKREKSRGVLKAIYAALNYFESPVPDMRAGIAALLEVLESRARQYAGDTAAGIGADDAGLRIAQSAVRNMDDGERQRLTVVVAALTKGALERYLSPAMQWAELREDEAVGELVEIRNGLERLILAGEELLATLLKPERAPAVADNMRKLNTDGMESEWKKWVPLLQQAVNQDFTLGEPGGGE
jgi:hypothetical protein